MGSHQGASSPPWDHPQLLKESFAYFLSFRKQTCRQDSRQKWPSNQIFKLGDNPKMRFLLCYQNNLNPRDNTKDCSQSQLARTKCTWGNLQVHFSSEEPGIKGNIHGNATTNTPYPPSVGNWWKTTIKQTNKNKIKTILISRSLLVMDCQNNLKLSSRATRQHQDPLPNALWQESHPKEQPHKCAGKAVGKAWNTNFKPGEKEAENLFRLIQNLSYNLPRLWSTALAKTRSDPGRKPFWSSGLKNIGPNAIGRQQLEPCPCPGLDPPNKQNLNSSRIFLTWLILQQWHTCGNLIEKPTLKERFLYVHKFCCCPDPQQVMNTEQWSPQAFVRVHKDRALKLFPFFKQNLLKSRSQAAHILMNIALSKVHMLTNCWHTTRNTENASGYKT